MTDRKQMKKIRKKRIKSIEKQVDKHEKNIAQEKGRKDTTKDYWQKEIDEKFLKQLEKDKKYLNKSKKENTEENGNSD
ncbi:MAG: hypothetical protein KKF56_01145 [Nanoarchaeota archaeon]|nr:hypothetical protein [Nanoarchaeota archaeon]